MAPLCPGFAGLLSASPAQFWASTEFLIALLIIIIVVVVVYALYRAIQLRLKPPKVAPLLETEKVVPTEDAKPNAEIYVIYRGEYWKARSPGGIVKGSPYSVSGKEGTVLLLEPLEVKAS